LPLISQHAAKPTACDWDNAQKDLSVAIYGILCDGSCFQFFAFDGSTKPYKFSIGLKRGSRFRLNEGLPLVDYPTAHHLIHNLRPICETVFHLLLEAYTASLKAFRNRWLNEGGWDEALKLAEEALKKSEDAEALRQDNSIVEADATTEAAFKALKLRYLVSRLYFPFKLTYHQYECGANCRALHQPTSDGWLGRRRGCENVKYLALCCSAVILAVFEDLKLERL
jgi:hypothetical protein